MKFVDYTNINKEYEFKITKNNDIKNILFLDIDGVINTPETYIHIKENTPLNKEKYTLEEIMEMDVSEIDFCNNYEREYINRLQKIIDTIPNTYICICSSNRQSHTHKYLEELLKNYGLKNFKYLGATPVVIYPKEKEENITIDLVDILNSNYEKKHCYRGEEVKYVLDYYNPKNYIILDDMSDYLEEQLEHFVKIKGWLGLQEEDVEKSIKILQKTY